MADRPVSDNTSDEIDLGQLFQMVGKGFNRLGTALLRLFLYLKKNALIIGGLTVVGFGLGYGLNHISRKKMKIEVIVKPNLESEDYLYDVVAEIGSNIKSRNFVYFKEIGIEASNLGQYEILIEPTENPNPKGEKDLEYITLLEKFRTNEEFLYLIKSELLNMNVHNHRVTFLFKDPLRGKVFAEKVMEYINTNGYFKELVAISKQNAKERIERNEMLIEQIDTVVSKYAQGLGRGEGQGFGNHIVLENGEPMGLTGLLGLKNELIKNTERKKIEAREQAQAISIINFGRVQQIRKVFLIKATILIPMVLLSLFFGRSILLEINKRAENLQ